MNVIYKKCLMIQIIISHRIDTFNLLQCFHRKLLLEVPDINLPLAKKPLSVFFDHLGQVPHN